MNKRNKEKNKLQEIFDETPEVKQFFFFGFYILFFIFIVILLRGAFNTNSISTTKYNSGYKYNFNIDDIKNNNYHFTYKLNKDNNLIIFDGDRFNEKLDFTMSGNPASDYYSEYDSYYLKNNNTLLYESCTNPMEFSNIIEGNVLGELFSQATYVSKTDYFDGNEFDYNYQISTSTILKTVNNMNVDIDDDVNTITAKVNKDSKLYEIDLDLTNYYKYLDNNIKVYKLELKYSKFGNIKNINKLK